MPTTTTNYALNLPTVGSDDDQWGSYLNTNFTKIDTQLKTLNDAIADQDLEELGNVVNTTPAEDQVLQFNGQNWSASTLAISDISGLQAALDDKADDSDLTGITTNPADGSVSYAKLNTALQVQVDRILLTDDDSTPTDNQILKYSATDAEWKFADLPGSTVQTLSDVNTAALTDDALLVYNSTAGEFQFESGATLRTTLGVDVSGTDNSTPVTLSGSLDYLTLSGQAITLQQINLTTDVTDTLPVASGGTGSATASDARTALGLQIGVNTQAYDAGLQSISGLTTAADKMLYTTASDTYAVATLTSAGRALLDDVDAEAQRTTLGLGTLATQSTITESQISDLQSYITASSTDTLTNKSGNISQWTNDAGYLTAETNDLSNVSGTLAIANGGTGSSTAATARVALLPALATNGSKLVSVNSGATDIEYIATSTLSITESQISDLQSYLTAETNDLSAAVVWANVPDANITQSSVTQHQAALSITESQISDLQTYLTASSTATLTNKSGNISQWTNDSGYLTAETNDLSTVSGTLGTANGGTGVTSLASLNAADLGSNNGVTDATDGYVLTADGTGGVAWEAATGGISDIVSDTTPQLGGSLDVNGQSIVSVSAGDIAITPDTTGKIILDGLSWPTADGSADQVLKTDGAGNLSFVDQSGGGGSGSSYIEHSSTVSDSLAISSGTNRMYIGNTTFSGSGTMAGYLVISHGYANFTGTLNVDTTGTLKVVS